MENRTTVFYVDDNPKSSRLLTSVLQECGFHVIAENGPMEALAHCRRTHFDLALLDYEMPLMSGAKLAQELKYLVPDVPVVLISGRAHLPPSELAFVDAHFGFGTALDDLLWTMRILVEPKVMTAEDRRADRSAGQRAAHSPADRGTDLGAHPGKEVPDRWSERRAMTQWADST